MESYDWLMRKDREGTRRIEKLSWGRLSSIVKKFGRNSKIGRAIISECRRCGYTPNVILGIHSR